MVETGLANAIVTGIVTGSIVALGAIGLALVYSIAEVPNFAHGELLMIGAFVALMVNQPSSLPFFGALATGPQSLGVAGFAVLFLVSSGATLTIVYFLGGREALTGSWWPVDPPPAVGVAGHLLGAAALGGLVVLGFPSLAAAMLFSVLVMAVIAPVTELAVFRQFRRQGVDLATMLIVALGLDFVMRFGTQAVFTGSIRSYEIPDTVSVLGVETALSITRFFDLYLGNGGLVVQVLSGTQGNPELALVDYGWPALAAILIATVGGTVVTYRVRRGQVGENTASTLSPRLAGLLAGAATLVALVLVLAGSGRVPRSPMASTRVSISFVRALVIVIAFVMMGSLHLLLRETKLGTAMRAASDNKDLARVTGIDTDRVMMATWVIAGVFAAVAGVMLGILFNVVSINMGFFLLLPMFAGVILGGIGSVYGAILGSIGVGIAMDVGIFALDIGATYRVPVAFLVLFVVLLVRPEGIAGGS